MVEVTVNDDGFGDAMRKAPKALFSSLKSTWFKHHTRFVTRMKTERLSGRPGLKTQTGTLKRGLIVKTEGTTLNTLEVRSVFTGPHAKFAHVHEHGMTIHAKNGKYLVFPIRAGGASRSTKIAGWAMVESVTIPARLGFEETWKRMLPMLFRRTNIAVGRALKGDNG